MMTPPAHTYPTPFQLCPLTIVPAFAWSSPDIVEAKREQRRALDAGWSLAYIASHPDDAERFVVICGYRTEGDRQDYLYTSRPIGDRLYTDRAGRPNPPRRIL